MTTCARPRTRDERGAALVAAIFASAIAFLLGMGILLVSEMEELNARAFTERTRARAAAEGAVRVAAAWFARPESAVGLPHPQEWVRDLRRGDSDLDGRLDAACDGSTEAGRWQGFPLVPASEDPDLGSIAARACGEAETPDLLLDHARTLDAMAVALGGRDAIVIERLAVRAGPAIGTGRSSLTIEATAAVRRGRLLVSRVTAVGRVSALPRLEGDQVIVAGGDVRLADGATVAWGSVHAAGDVVIPRIGSDGALRSGLPRRSGGGAAGWVTGGVTDWDLDTTEREYLLTELIGRSVQGVQVPSAKVRAPELPDPWLAVHACGSIFDSRGRVGRPLAKQPMPYDPRVTTVRDDLSFLFAVASGEDALAEGRLERIAEITSGTTAGGSALRRFTLDASAEHGEARWRENGAGPARTAQQWMDAGSGEPSAAVFVAAGAPIPELVTLRAPLGIVIVEARRLVLATGGDAAQVVTHMPGEPWLDTGIDADGDGEIDPGTVANGKWDHDFDMDGVADAEEAEGWELAADLGPAYFVPYFDQDPALRRTRPHEAFLNLAYPAGEEPGPVRVCFRAEADGLAAPVKDEGAVELTTTLGHDAIGARVRVPAHAHAVVANVGGDVELAAGYQLLGSIRAKGSVTLAPGAAVRLDARLARDGRLDLPMPVAALTGVAFPSAPTSRRPHEAAPGRSSGSAGDGGGDETPSGSEPGDRRKGWGGGAERGPGRPAAPPPVESVEAPHVNTARN